MEHKYCIIMAGGAGTRLWPISRAAKPKQFIGIRGKDKTFLRNTYDRFAGFIPKENIIVATTGRYADLVRAQLPELPQENILVEPYSRNTAPCIAYSAYTLLKRDPEAAMIVSPADHLINDMEGFQHTVINALDYACKEKALVTLGVKPTRPDTNYGYIQITGGRSACTPDKAIKVKTFIEKPDADLAKVLVDSGEFFWNAGIFIWKAEIILEEMEKHLPAIPRQFKGWDKVLGSAAESEFIARAYTGCPNISIDYGVMEKTDKAWLYPTSFDWADIGAWESLHEFWPKKDAEDNAFVADKILSSDNQDNLFITSQKGKLLAIKGLSDYVVIDTKDVLLICPKDDRQIKELISDIAMPEYEKYK